MTSLTYLLSFLCVFIYSVRASSFVPGGYIVEFAPSRFEKRSTHERLLQYLQRFDQQIHIRHTFDSDMFRGIALHINNYNEYNDHEHPILKGLRNDYAVKQIYPMQSVARPKWITEPDHPRPYSGKLSQIEQVQQQYGLTGKGVLIGVIDTGVDYYHPALGGGFGEGFKIRYGANLVPSEIDKIGKPLSPNDPYDPCLGFGEGNGHGTHVTGIIGGVDASMNFTGVAPDATLGVWRVFGCSDATSEDLVIKAMEMAYQAGCDIINISSGTESAWGESASAVAANRLAESGLIVVSVANNEGSQGVFLQSSPGTGRHVISVGSVKNDVVPTHVVQVSDFPGKNFLYQPSTTTTDFPNGTLITAYNQNGEMISACSNTKESLPSLKDKLVLLRSDGKCSFAEKLNTIATKGALGGVIYSPNNNSTDSFIIADTTNSHLPAITIPTYLANDLKDLHEPTQLLFPTKYYDNVGLDGGQVSEFSSVGPNYELDLKPNIAGIGTAFSTLPRHMNHGWGIRSGTSMAAPHITGLIALMLEHYRSQGIKVDGSYILEMLQIHGRLASYQDQPDHPLYQGAGLAQPLTSLLSPLHISPAQVSLNDTTTLDKGFSFTISNSGPTELILVPEHIPSKAIHPFPNAKTFVVSEPNTRGDEHVQLEFSEQQIILAPGSTKTVRVQVQLPSQVYYHYQMYGGYVAFRDAGNSQAITASLPYFGVLGRMIDLPMLDTGFPYLCPPNDLHHAYSETDTYVLNVTKRASAGPTVVYRLLTASARVEMNLIELESKRVIGRLNGTPQTYLNRNTLSASARAYQVPWNSFIASGADTTSPLTSLDNGKYQIQVRVLKLFGNPESVQDWETWTSGVILVKH